jgi:hypothetical protein
MIQALPEAVRQEYENLEVETVIFYPARLVADSGPAYDELVARQARSEAPWEASLDLERLEQITVEHLDADYVSLRCPIGTLAQQIAQYRREAREAYGKGSGAEQAWKLQANSIYGVVASPYLTTNNVVCANVITATARALAFAMQMSLNGFQVITDGCSYRRDQVPAGTFAECLAASAEYPIRRPEGGVAYHDPGVIPDNDSDFTAWYRRHVRQFFGVGGDDYDWLFGLHDLEHKRTGAAAASAFDALCCDGSGNYLKLVRNGMRWEVVEFKARSYKKEEKALLEPWILQTYVEDNYTGPPPITESTSLLSYKDAVRVGRLALRHLEGQRSPEELAQDRQMIYFPLGLDQRKLQAYKVIKPSAFLCRTPEQRANVVRAMQKFADNHACGLEVLSLRRCRGGRRKGSLVDVAEALYQFIRGGGDNLTRALNLTRSFRELAAVRSGHTQSLLERQQAARERLYDAIDRRRLDEDTTMLTGLYVQTLDSIEVS